MDEAIYDLRLGGMTMPGLLTVPARPFGPAGVSEVELADGSRWQIDHAVPANPTMFEVPSEHGGDSPLLVAAFGGDEALFLANSAQPWESQLDPDTPEDRMDWTPLPRSPAYIQGMRPSRPRAGEAGVLVLLADAIGDGRLHPLSRLAAALQLDSLVYRLAGGSLLEPLRDHNHARAERLADDLDPTDVADLGAAELAQLFELAQLLDGGSRSGITPLRRFARLLGDELARRDHSGAPAADGLAPTGAPLPDAEPLIAAMTAPPLSDTDLGPGPPMPVVERVDHALVRVSVPRSEQPRWVRLLERDGLALVGAAPLERSGIVDVAEVLVPVDLVTADLVAEAVEAEAMGRGSSRGTTAADVRTAINLGRDAARADRMNQRQHARRLWTRCSDAWQAINDHTRADTARVYASKGVPERVEVPGPVRTLLVDRVETALGTSAAV